MSSMKEGRHSEARPMIARAFCGAVLAIAVAAPVQAAQRPGREGSIIVNSVRLSAERVRSLERQYGVHIPAGSYWYDRVSGAWGLQGGPTRGFTLPGLSVGGPLRANASHGNTRVFINGRELPRLDLAALQRIVPWRILPGRYWVDACGNAGRKGGPVACNLVQLSRAAGRRGGAWSVDTRTTDAHVGGDGKGFLFYIDHDSSWTAE